jgi:hypothetical protein
MNGICNELKVLSERVFFSRITDPVAVKLQKSSRENITIMVTTTFTQHVLIIVTPFLFRINIPCFAHIII